MSDIENIFVHDSKTYIAIDVTPSSHWLGCLGCAFLKIQDGCYDASRPACCSFHREDGRDIIWEKVKE